MILQGKMQKSEIRLYQHYIDQDRTSVRLSVLVVVIIYLANYHAKLEAASLIWLFVMLSLQLLRLWNLRQLHDALSKPAALAKRLPALDVVAVLAAVSWGAILFVFEDGQGDFLYLFNMICLAAILSLSILSHGLIFRIYVLFCTTVLAIVIAHANIVEPFGSPRYRYAMSAMSLLYLAFLLVTSWKYAKRNRDFFQQQVAMESLVSELKNMHATEKVLRARVERKSARLERKARQLRVIAETDGLTKILNRGAILRRLDQFVLNLTPQAGHFCVILFDVDNFKSINDTQGHNVGDQVLKILTAEVQSILRLNDLFGRLGGEEFVVLLPETHLPDAVDCAERIRDFLEHNPRMRAETGLSVTLSLGCCAAVAGENPIDLLGRADQLMYQAKQMGKNRVAY